jgi:glycine/D-amino acid oxidase-like deaminating enzyme
MSILYHDTAENAADFAALASELSADVCVVGGGITGLSTALHAAERGLKVVLLEARQPGFGASGRNGGQVNPGLKFDPDTIERKFGSDLGTRMVKLSGGAPQYVFDLVKRLNIRCEARQQGTLRAAVGENHAAMVRETARQLASRGAPVEVLEREAIAKATGTTRYALALLDKRGGDLNPLSYARGLALAAAQAGATLHGKTRARALERRGSQWRILTDGGAVTASHVVLATNGYTDDLWPALRRSVVPVFGALMASEPLPESAAGLILPGRSVLYESGQITVYYRVDGGNRLLFGGRGPMHEVTQRGEVLPLRRYALKLWPALAAVNWQHVWGGRLCMTSDHYPHVHEPAPGILACLGYNGRGVAMGTVMGAQLARRIASPEAGLDMPLSPIRTIPLHVFWRWGVRAAILRGRLLDALGR